MVYFTLGDASTSYTQWHFQSDDILNAIVLQDIAWPMLLLEKQSKPWPVVSHYKGSCITYPVIVSAMGLDCVLSFVSNP